MHYTLRHSAVLEVHRLGFAACRSLFSCMLHKYSMHWNWLGFNHGFNMFCYKNLAPRFQTETMCCVVLNFCVKCCAITHDATLYTSRMWANAQRDGRPAEYRWRPLFYAAKFGWRPILECRAVTLPRRETCWNLQGCPKLANRSQPLVGRRAPYYGDMWRT